MHTGRGIIDCEGSTAFLIFVMKSIGNLVSSNLRASMACKRTLTHVSRLFLIHVVAIDVGNDFNCGDPYKIVGSNAFHKLQKFGI